MTFQTWSRGGRTGYAVPEFPGELLAQLVATPELPLMAATTTTVKAGNSALVVRAMLPLAGRNVAVAYKRVRRKTWLKRLTQATGTNRTLRTFLAGHRLLAAGIPTARPLAVLVPSRFDLLAPAWIATEWLEGAEDLTVFAVRCRAGNLTTEAVRAVSATVGGLIGRMHAAGITHRDLKPQNVMVRWDESIERAEAFAVDLDGVGFAARVGEATRWRNVSRLAIGEEGWRAFGPACRKRFLDAYLAEAACTSDWREAWRALSAASQGRVARRAA